MSGQQAFATAIERNLSYFSGRLEKSGLQLSLLQAEQQNIYRAIDFGARLPQTNTSAATLLLRLFTVIEQHGNCLYWAQLYIRVANRFEGDVCTLCLLLNNLGQLQRHCNQYEHAMHAHQRALAFAEENELHLDRADSLYYIASVFQYQHEWQAMEKYARMALQCYSHDCDERAERTKKGIGYALSAIAVSAAAQERIEEAETLYQSAIDQLIAADAPYQAARVYVNLGNLLLRQQNVAAAEAQYLRARDLLDGSGYVVDDALVRLNLAVLYYERGDCETARQMLESIDYHMLRKQGRMRLCGLLKNNLGNVMLCLARYEQAAQQLAEAIAIWQTVEDPVELANSIGSLGHIRGKLNQPKRAERLYREALARLDACGDSAHVRALRAEFNDGLKRLFPSDQSMNDAVLRTP